MAMGNTVAAKEKEIGMNQSPVQAPASGNYYRSTPTVLGKTHIAKEKEIGMLQVPIAGEGKN